MGFFFIPKCVLFQNKNMTDNVEKNRWVFLQMIFVTFTNWKVGDIILSLNFQEKQQHHVSKCFKSQVPKAMVRNK